MTTKNQNNTFTYLINSNSFDIDGVKDFVYEIKKSDILLDDLILSSSSKRKISQVVEEHRNGHKLKKFNGLKPIHKIILNGASGCWKTTSALGIANALDKWIIIVNLSEIISSRLGETSKNLNKVIKYAQESGYIIFFDEFDSISRHRNDEKELWEMRRLVNSLIQLLDFAPDGLLIIAATNNLEAIDTAIARRFEEVVLFEKPNKAEIELYIDRIESGFRGMVKIGASLKLIDKFLWFDFFKIHTTINNAVKRKVLQSDGGKVSLTVKDIFIS
jgi:AAA+ superfamily predicted ATPase